MNAWPWVAIFFDSAAAIVFLIVGYAGRQRVLMGAGLVLLVALMLMGLAIALGRDDVASWGYLLGWAACAVGAYLLWPLADRANAR